jgi:hypothetical protein
MSSFNFDDFTDWIPDFLRFTEGDDEGKVDWGKIAGVGGGVAGLLGLFEQDEEKIGYQGKIPDYTAVRGRVPVEWGQERTAGASQPQPYIPPETTGGITDSPTLTPRRPRGEAKPTSYEPMYSGRRPGQNGRQYFSDVVYAQKPESNTPTVGDAEATVDAQIAALVAGEENNAAPITTEADAYARALADQAAADQAAADTPATTTPAVTVPTGDRQLTLGGNPNVGLVAGDGTKNSQGGYAPESMLEAPAIASPYRTLSLGDVQDQLGQYSDNPAYTNPFEAFRSGGYAAGGIVDGMPQQVGMYLGGSTDGMGDEVDIKAADGEFIVPADVVGHLGNGNSEAGAGQLYAMMDRIRQARTGSKEQGNQINPNDFTLA